MAEDGRLRPTWTITGAFWRRDHKAFAEGAGSGLVLQDVQVQTEPPAALLPVVSLESVRVHKPQNRLNNPHR